MRYITITILLIICVSVYADKIDTFAIYYNKSIDAKNKGSIKLSINTLKEGVRYVRTTSDSAKMYNAFASLYIGLTDFNNALIYLDSAVTRVEKENIGFVYINYGLAHTKLLNFDRARDYYVLASSTLPERSRGVVFHNLGKLFSFAGKPDSAEYFFERAFEHKLQFIGKNSYSTLLSALEFAEYDSTILNRVRDDVLSFDNNSLLGMYYTIIGDFEKARLHHKGNHFQLLRLHAKYNRWIEAVPLIDSVRNSLQSVESKLFLANNERLIYKNAIEEIIKYDTLKAYQHALKSRANLLKQNSLNEGELPVANSYFVFDSITYHFYWSNNKQNINKIKTDSIFWDKYYSYLSGFKPENFKKRYYENYKKFCETGFYLYKKLIPNLENKQTLIIPDGALHFLPFECLPTSMPDTSFPDYSSIDYVMDSSIISYDYCLNSHRKSNKRNLRITAFAPDSRLKYSKSEIEQLQKLFHAETYSNKEATTDKIGEADILHLSTHYDPINETFLFYGENLAITDISELESEMVVLASCYSGFGQKHIGEGVFSPGREFYNHGAHSIVEAIWQSDDRSTAKIIIDFYKELSKGKSKPEALNTAKRNYLNTTLLDHHPYYWANLRFFGNPYPIQLQKRSTSLYVFVGILVLVLSIVVFKNFPRRN